MYEIDLNKEAIDIENGFEEIIESWNSDKKNEETIKEIRKAFDIAVEAHKDMRRKSGEPYILHPIAVAKIATKELGLGKTSIICALLHDVVEDTDYTLEDMKEIFGEKVANIIDGLTKISEVSVINEKTSPQAETFRKVILSFAYDIRVILIKLADRLHNMRTLEFMARDKQMKIASETEYIYSPLAHRLGYFLIKDELEDLSLKYLEPELYSMIKNYIVGKKAEYDSIISKFINPISDELTKLGMKFEINTRFKTVHSVWKKMREKKVDLDDIEDLFAIRIIVDSNEENEKFDCWKIYAVITNFYNPKQDRLRDWISTPKANGYEALHTTVMSQTGNWIEVQIRSRRMDEIAEKGIAAHWKYKYGTQNAGVSKLDQWILRMRELIETQQLDVLDNDSIGFIDDFKNNLFTDEIFVFTPKGDLRTLPADSTVLDFAYAVHSELGETCIAAKINNSLASKYAVLHNGDQIEIITSKKQFPTEEWLKNVKTQRAKTKIRSFIKSMKKDSFEKGKEIVDNWLDSLNLPQTDETYDALVTNSRCENITDFYYKVVLKQITIEEIKKYFKTHYKSRWYSNLLPFGKSKDSSKLLGEIVNVNAEQLLLGENISNLSYKLCNKCNPIPGDEVVGLTDMSNRMIIHRTNCADAINFMSKYGNRIVKAKWRKEDSHVGFLTKIEISGIDRKGILGDINNVFIEDFKINIRKMLMEAKDNIFRGSFTIYISDADTLKTLIAKLKKVEGVQSIIRVNRGEEKLQ